MHLNHPFVSIPADACVILSPRSVVEPSELHMLPPRSRKNPSFETSRVNSARTAAAIRSFAGGVMVTSSFAVASVSFDASVVNSISRSVGCLTCCFRILFRRLVISIFSGVSAWPKLSTHGSPCEASSGSSRERLLASSATLTGGFELGTLRRVSSNQHRKPHDIRRRSKPGVDF